MDEAVAGRGHGPDVFRGNYKYFTESEMACKCGCGKLPTHSHMKILVRTRRGCGFPFVITSGARCEEYNKSIKGGPAHPAGKASDIQASGWHALKIIVVGYIAGFRGFGVSQKGKHKDRFIHVDNLPNSDKAPRPWIWSY